MLRRYELRTLLDEIKEDARRGESRSRPLMSQEDIQAMLQEQEKKDDEKP
jgi:hypothetical protein